MSVAVPHVRVGEPVRCQSLSVFPLFDGQQTPVEYLLSDEGIGSGSVTVEEVSEGGSVPNLFVENKGDVRVLFLEGEQLVGAKQNRVLEHFGPDRRQEQGQDPRQLRRARPVAIPLQALRLQRQPFALQAPLLPEVIGQPCPEGKDGPQVGPGQGVGRSCTASRKHSAHLRVPMPCPIPLTATRSRWPTFRKSCATSMVHRAWPWRLARRSSPWTCSTSLQPAERSGIG